MRKKRINPVLSDDEVLAECRYQSAQSTGSEFASDELIESRAQALKAYMGKPIGNEVEGNSTVQSMDVADAVHAILSQIMPVFGTDSLVQFEALGEQDEEQARTESNFCNNIVMERNNGFILFETLLKDALLSRTAPLKSG